MGMQTKLKKVWKLKEKLMSTEYEKKPETKKRLSLKLLQIILHKCTYCACSQQDQGYNGPHLVGEIA